MVSRRLAGLRIPPGCSADRSESDAYMVRHHVLAGAALRQCPFLGPADLRRASHQNSFLPIVTRPRVAA